MSLQRGRALSVAVAVLAVVGACRGTTTARRSQPTRTTTEYVTKKRTTTTTAPHPSCQDDAYYSCQNSCREKNYEVLDTFIADVVGRNADDLDLMPDLNRYATGNGGSGNATDRRRRGTVPNYVINEVNHFLKNNVRCADAKLKRKRSGVCVCSCKSKRVRLDCSHIQNGGFTDGTDWDVRERGQTVSEVTDEPFFTHDPSWVPLGNGNFQGIAAGPTTLPEFAPVGPQEGPGQIILRQRFKLPKGELNHVLLVYGMATGLRFRDFAPFIGPNTQGFRVDIVKKDAAGGPFSVHPDDVVESLVIGSGITAPNVYVHDITRSVGNGGKYHLRYTAAALFDSQTVAVDHVHMCSIACD